MVMPPSSPWWWMPSSNSEVGLDDVRRAHGVEDRAQGVVEGEDMRAAAGDERQHGLPGEGDLREQVEQRLEDAGVGGLVDGGAG